MSNLANMEFVEVNDKRLMVTNERQYGVYKGPIDIMYSNFNSSSFSNSSYNVSVTGPTDTVLSNRVIQTVSWRIVLQGTATVGPNLIPVDSNGNIRYCGFRAFALDNATKNLSVNGRSE